MRAALLFHDERVHQSRSELSIIAPVENDGSWKGTSWYRFITLGGQPVYKLGPNCETCEFFLARVGEGMVSIDHTRDALNEFSAERTDKKSVGALVKTFTALLPNGKYTPILAEIYPRQAASMGSKSSDDKTALEFFAYAVHDERWAETAGGHMHFFEEWIIPVRSPIPAHLNTSTVVAYQQSIDRGRQALAICISILEEHQGNTRLLHFLLDGHHKTEAAARRASSLWIISFLSHDFSLGVRSRRRSFLKSMYPRRLKLC
jgi:hypothetical protein